VPARRWLYWTARSPAFRIPLRKILQLDMQKAGLDRIETPVVTLDIVVVFLRLAVIAQHLDLVGNGCIVCGNRSRFATRSPDFFPG